MKAVITNIILDSINSQSLQVVTDIYNDQGVKFQTTVLTTDSAAANSQTIDNLVNQYVLSLGSVTSIQKTFSPLIGKSYDIGTLLVGTIDNSPKLG